MVGIYVAIGLPFPKPEPVLKFGQWLTSEVCKYGGYSYSTKNIPVWWMSEDKASEGM